MFDERDETNKSPEFHSRGKKSRETVGRRSGKSLSRSESRSKSKERLKGINNFFKINQNFQLQQKQKEYREKIKPPPKQKINPAYQKKSTQLLSEGKSFHLT